MTILKKPTVIMISIEKGGTGKTTCTLELCSTFGKEYKVLGIDLDPQMNFTMYSGADEQSGKTLKNVLDADMLIEDSVQHLKDFDIVPGDKKLANASKLYGDADDIYLLKDALEDMDGYDFIFLDSAPARSPLLYMEYVASDYIIAPTECDDGSIQGLLEIGEDINRFRKHGQTHVRVLGTLMNKMENTAMHKASYEDLESLSDRIGGKPFRTKIRKSIAASEAKTMKESITDYSPKNNVAKDYQSLKEEILTRLEEAENSPDAEEKDTDR